MRDDLARFRDPPAEYRPVPFWSWNEVLEPDEVRRQLRLLADAGCGGAFMHSRTGLITPYLGEQWFDAVAVVVETCRDLGLKVWLYDEDTWPSGFSGGSVPLADPQHRPMALFAAAEGQAVPPGSEPMGPPREGLCLYRYLEPLGNPRFNGTTYINPLHRPAVARFIHDAYEPYRRRFGSDYGGLIPAVFTDEPSAMSLASRLPAGAVPFAPELLDHYQRTFHEDASPRLHLLFVDAPGAAAFRVRYHRAVNDLFTRNFTRQLADWCERRGIAFTGHYIYEGELHRQHEVGTMVAGQHRYMHIPGIDHLGLQVRERVSGKVCQSAANQFRRPRMLSELYGAAGQHLSLADQLWIGRQQAALGVNLFVPHLALYTMSGCRKRDYPANLFYQQPWWPLARVAADDLARLSVALAQGRFHARVLVIHPAESVAAVWRSQVHRLGTEAPRMDRGPVNTEGRAAVEPIDRNLRALVDLLLGERIGFDIGEAGALADAGRVVHDGGVPWLEVGAMRYRVIVLPHILTLRPATFALLRTFTDAGGHVLREHDGPTLLDGEPSEALTAWSTTLPQRTGADLTAALHLLAPQPVVFQPADACGDQTRRLVWAHVRDLPDGGRVVYAVNLSRQRTAEGELRLLGPWRCGVLLDTATGDAADATQLRRTPDLATLPLRLSPCHHLLLRLTPADGCADRPATRAAAAAPPAAAPATPRVVDADFSAARVERLDDNAMVLDTARFREGGGPWSARPLPVIAIQHRLNALRYVGPVTLRYPLRTRGLSSGRGLRLVVEYPERYRIRVNGTPVAYDGLPFWRDIRWWPIDITGLLREGDNTIELHGPAFRFGDPTCFDRPADRYGTELEAVYVVGDFSVAGACREVVPPSPAAEDEPPAPRRFVFDAESLHLTDPAALRPGDLTTQGLPFYAGRVRLAVERPAWPAGQALRIAGFDAAAAQVAIHGRVVGEAAVPSILIAPPPPEATPPTRLSLTLFGTLRNLLGPHHRPGDEPRWVGPADFHPAYPDGSPHQVAGEVARWASGSAAVPGWTRDYSVVSFGSCESYASQSVRTHG